MLIKDVRALLMGKVISYYDGWNGSRDYFKIGHIEKRSNTLFCVYAEKGKGWGVVLTDECIKKLAECNEYKRKNTIEGGTYEIRYSLC